MLNSCKKINENSFLRQGIVFLYNKTNVALTYFANTGFLAFSSLCLQILTGIFLVCWYIPNVQFAFFSISFIMLEVPYGWFIRYWHVTGASFFFFFVYLHIIKNIFYGSFKAPKHFVWLTGCFILILMMIIAFFGYILPWGDMSYWATVVVSNVFTVFGSFGLYFSIWLSGGIELGQHTLSKFFAFHFCLPFFLLFIIFLHFFLLHNVCSTSPFGVKEHWDFLIFEPFFRGKDLWSLFFILNLQLLVVCLFPTIFMHAENFEVANLKTTPLHIVPEWYFLPFYGILRVTPSKTMGVFLVFVFFLLLVSLPFFSFITFFGGRTIHFNAINQVYYYYLLLCIFFAGYFGNKTINEITLCFGSIVVSLIFLNFLQLYLYIDFYFFYLFYFENFDILKLTYVSALIFCFIVARSFEWYYGSVNFFWILLYRKGRRRIQQDLFLLESVLFNKKIIKILTRKEQEVNRQLALGKELKSI